MWTALLACAAPTPPVDDTGWDRGEDPYALDDLLRANHVQVKGTHNSYHQPPDALVDASFDYAQPPLTAQLDRWGVRQLELDVHLGDDGAWRVFHLPALDDRSSCPMLADCLAEIKSWSDDHGWALPLVVWLEPKDDVDGLVDGLVAIGDQLDTLDDAILAVWPRSRLFTPDDLRGDHATLAEALASDGWPVLRGLRGKALFALLDSDAHRATYLARSDVLAGRVMFVDATDPAQPYAAMVKDGTPDEITALAEAGLLVTTNGSAAADDAATAAAADAGPRDAGVHHLATDLPADDAGAYWLDLAPRCNPVTAPAECRDDEVERP